MLRKAFRLNRLDEVLETPLDQYVAAGLKKDAEAEFLPRWTRIIAVTPKDNAIY